MQKLYRNCLIVILIVIAIAVGWYISQHNVPVLETSGVISGEERKLIAIVFGLMLIVALPVFGLTIFIAWHYRESNHTAKYQPDYDTNRVAELTWWGIPVVLIVIIGTITWISSYDLDPYKPINDGAIDAEPTLHIQVVSLDWKWLFIYPHSRVASVNMAMIPVNEPVEFNITSDSVMNSFWVPALGSQMYTMPGMKTKLNLMATKSGSFYGSSANISGVGFAGMHFTVKAVPSSQFDSWIKALGTADKPLTTGAYAKLAKPSRNNPVSYYSSVTPGLFDKIVMQYMVPNAKIKPGHGMTSDMTNMTDMRVN